MVYKLRPISLDHGGFNSLFLSTYFSTLGVWCPICLTISWHASTKDHADDEGAQSLCEEMQKVQDKIEEIEEEFDSKVRASSGPIYANCFPRFWSSKHNSTWRRSLFTNHAARVFRCPPPQFSVNPKDVFFFRHAKRGHQWPIEAWGIFSNCFNQLFYIILSKRNEQFIFQLISFAKFWPAKAPKLTFSSAHSAHSAYNIFFLGNNETFQKRAILTVLALTVFLLRFTPSQTLNSAANVIIQKLPNFWFQAFTHHPVMLFFKNAKSRFCRHRYVSWFNFMINNYMSGITGLWSSCCNLRTRTSSNLWHLLLWRKRKI